MRPYFLFLFFIVDCIAGYGQTQAVYSELGGESMWLSINYDRRFNKTNDGLGFRMGVGSNLGSRPSGITIPVGVNWLGGRRGNFVELGAGITWFSMTGLDFNHRYNLGNKTYQQDERSLLGNLVLGYRRQPKNGGLSLRAGIAPFAGAGTTGMVPYFGLGYCFN
jgi:hypothetical protein